jgi:hypothetical protein
MVTELVSAIDPTREETWRGKVFLTLDLDWANDEVLDVAVNLLKPHGLKCTLFATHLSPGVEQLTRHADFEVGVHPKFDSVAAASREPDDDPSSLGSLMATFPRARSIRSHSLVQSSRLHSQFAEFGFTHESNVYVPCDAGIALRPWTIWNGLIRVPFVWADDIHLYRGGGDLRQLRVVRDQGLCVLAFHPIHLYLNTDSVATYERYKSATRRGETAAGMPDGNRRGIRNVFADLVNLLQ